jgi:ribosomal protein S1
MSKKDFTINTYTEGEVLELNAVYNNSFETGFLKVGKSVTGKLIDKNNKFATFTSYGKSNIIVPLSISESEIISNLEIGDTIGILITDVSDLTREYKVTGSISEMKKQEVTKYMQKCVENSTSLVAIIAEANSGGFICEIVIENVLVSLFMPFTNSNTTRIENTEEWIGKEIDILLEKNTKDNKVTYFCSHKKYLLSLIPAALEKIKKDTQYTGVVSGKSDFGVFVQFNNCLSGMIHKSNLLDLISSIEIGDNIEFFVKDIVKDRLFLTQELKDSLWDSIQNGDEIVAKVSSIKEYGIMVQLDYETKGLLHKSNLKGRSIDDWKKDDIIYVKVTNVNKTDRQITLALN